MQTTETNSSGRQRSRSHRIKPISFPSETRLWEGKLRPQKSRPIVLAIGGAKGGSGKSMISANLGIQLSQLGLNTALIDLDFGSPNLHTYLGLRTPEKTIAQFLQKTKPNLGETLIKTPMPNLFLSGGTEIAFISNLASVTKRKLSKLSAQIRMLKSSHQIDMVICDLGAGTQKHNIELFLNADIGILSIMPEVSSIENGYAFLKAMISHILLSTLSHTKTKELTKTLHHELLKSNKLIPPNGYIFELEEKLQKNRPLLRDIKANILQHNVGIVLNSIKSHQDIEVGESIVALSRKYFGFDTENLGHISFDQSAWKAHRSHQAVSNAFPHSLITKHIQALAKVLSAQFSE